MNKISEDKIGVNFPKLSASKLLGLSLLLAVGDAWSQQLEEIVVVAQKKLELAQDVPIALSAFSGDDLIASGVKELSDISKIAPGVVFETTSTSSQPLLFVRGIGTRQFQLGSDPSVGVFVDGVYVPRFAAQSAGLLDVERIEILKGPQGTVYGRNTIGGAINIITRSPTEELSGNVEVGYGQGDRNDNDIWNIKGSVYGSLSDNALFGIAVSHSEDDGSILLRNPLTGETGRGFGRENDSIRGKLDFTLSDTVGLKLTASYSEDDNSPRIFVPDNPSGLRSHGFPSLLNAALRDPSQISQDPFVLNTDVGVLGFSQREVTDFSVVLDWDTKLGTVTSITSYGEVDLHEVGDGDATEFNAQTVAVIEESESFSQEIRLVGGTDDGKWGWLAGIYLYDDDANRQDIVGIGPDSRLADNAIAQAIYADFALNPRDPFGIGINTPVDIFDTTLESSGEAVFGQLTYQVTENFSIIAGIRYSQDDKVSPLIATTELPLVPGPFIRESFSLTGADVRKDDWSSTDPAITFNYTPSDDVLLYASYRTGYKSGGFQDFNGNPVAAAVAFDEEGLDAIEVGIKSELFNRRVRFNASVFNYDYEDLQLQGPLEEGSPVRVTTNAASTTLNGLDLEIKALITESFTIDLTYAYLDAEFDDYEQNLGTVLLDFRGTRLPQAPEHKLNLVGTYNIDTRYGELGFRAAISHSDDILLVQEANNVDPGTGILGDSGLTEPSRTTLDSNINLARDNWVASFYAQNLTNKLYRVAAVEQQSNTALLTTFNQPRTLGVRLTYDF